MKISDLLEATDVHPPLYYNAWVRWTPQSVDLDFQEYKKKEATKWMSRAKQIGARFPLFNTAQEFASALDHAPIVNIDVLPEDVHNLTRNTSLLSIKHIVGSYQLPRDVDRIVQGYENDQPLPLPIILKGRKGMWIMAGNTRQSTARVLGITPKALLVDVSDQ